MANPLTNFTVTAESRHPDNPHRPGYDNNAHAYRADYVNPPAWRLHLDACAQLPTEVEIEPPNPTDGEFKPVIDERPGIPSDVVGYEWTVERVPSGFRKVVSGGPPGLFRCQGSVDVPSPGTYTITLAIRLVGGGFLRSDPMLYRLRDALVVSLGESAASGQGNPDVPGEPTLLGSGQCELTTLSAIIDGFGIGVSMEREPTWQEPLAYRSYKSGPSRAALALQQLQERRAGKVVTFLSFASSGAEIETGLFQPQRDFQDVGQIEEARRTVAGRRIDALLLSIGGNDVGFGPGLRELVKDFVGKGQDATFEEINHEIDLLPRKYRLLAERIEDRLNPRKVFITEYPTAMFDRSDGTPGGGCGIFDSLIELDISAEDGRRIREAGRRLNEAVQAAADEHGWVFVDGIEAGFAGHGYCSDDSFFVHAEDSCRQQGDFEGTMHPTAAGHAVYSRCLKAALARHLFPRVPLGPKKRVANDDTVTGAAEGNDEAVTDAAGV
jgi:lysophospholipase L1-like esterase